MSLKSIPLHNTSNQAKKEDKNIADNKVSRTWMTKINHAIKILMIILSVFFIGYLLESYRDVSVLLGNYFEISTELLPLVLSFSIFVMTWHAYAKNKSSYSLFLGAAFLATGVFDLYHMISYPFMPDFITRNTPQKEALFWILARLISTILFLASVYIYKDSLIRLINKPGMFVSINVLSIILLIEVLRDSDQLPAMYYPDGSFSAILIFVILLTSVIILYTSYLYTKRRQESGQNSTVCLIYGFIIIVCSNLVSISYDYSGNLLRAAGYYFVYLALFSSSIEQPYEKLVLAQDKLRHVAEERYRNLFDNANDAIITTDFEDRITSWNWSAEKMFGWAEQEVTGKNLSLLIFPQNLMEEIENSIRNAISGKELIGFETACLCKDGTKIDVSMTISPLRDANHEIIGLSAIIRDITERKKTEEALRAKPDMRISISTNRNEYNPLDTIATTVTLRNNGNDKIKNVELNIDPGTLELEGGSLNYNFNEIPAGQSKSLILYFKAPLLAEAKSITIGVNASGTDVKNINYSASASIKIKILQNRIIEVQKTLASSIYNDEITSAYITIRNKGAINLDSIEVKDEIPDGFTSENDINLLWSLNLASGEEKRISYPLKPLLPGTYDVPAAQAQFAIGGKQYIVKSNTSRITVHAPLIVLTKTVDSAVAYLGDQITVTINVRNEGDKQARVKITDDLPSKADLLSGDLSWTAVLEKNESKSYTYTMKLNKAGELELPPAKANITYLQNSYNFTVSSRNLAVLVVESLDKKQIATSSPSIPARTSTPGFGGIIASIAFIFIYLIKRKRGALECE